MPSLLEPMNLSVRSWPLSLGPIPASLLLISAALGSIVLVSLAVLTLIPVVVILGSLFVWMVATVLLGWAGIEGLAALERWMEGDPRFLR